jgi:RNA polymerase sigma-70 factor (ECF subfamily)
VTTSPASNPAAHAVGLRPTERDAGDLVVFEQTYLAHYRELYRFLLSLTRDHAEAEDLAGEAFARAFERWRTGDLHEDHLAAWLFLTGRRLAIDTWRRARRFARLQLRAESSADSDLARAEYKAWIERLVTILTPRQAEVILLRYQHSFNDREIAQILDISESGVRSLAARAIEKLRQREDWVR